MIFSTSLSMLKALTQIHPHPLPCTHISLDSKATLPWRPGVGLVSLSINLSASLRSEYIHQTIQHYITMLRSSSLQPSPQTTASNRLSGIYSHEKTKQNKKHLEARRITWFQVAGDLVWAYFLHPQMLTVAQLLTEKLMQQSEKHNYVPTF